VPRAGLPLPADATAAALARVGQAASSCPTADRAAPRRCFLHGNHIRNGMPDYRDLSCDSSTLARRRPVGVAFATPRRRVWPGSRGPRRRVRLLAIAAGGRSFYTVPADRQLPHRELHPQHAADDRAGVRPDAVPDDRDRLPEDGRGPGILRLLRTPARSCMRHDAGGPGRRVSGPAWPGDAGARGGGAPAPGPAPLLAGPRGAARRAGPRRRRQPRMHRQPRTPTGEDEPTSSPGRDSRASPRRPRPSRAPTPS
jgi:hypothetical protein